MPSSLSVAGETSSKHCAKVRVLLQSLMSLAYYFQREAAFFVLFVFADVIKEKGIENVTVEDLVAGVTPKGRGKMIFLLHLEQFTY